MQREQKRITKNGVEIYSYANPSIHGFYISLFLRAGSMYEEHQGITHFLEHISIRNVNAVMNGALYPTLDKYGIEFNATTYTEMVQFYISGASENFGIASEIIAKLLSPIVLSARDISLERDRIKAEIREGDDATALSTFAGGIVHEGTKLANLITGTVGSVNKINKALLEEYRSNVENRSNIFFYVTGCFDGSDLDKLSCEIEKYTLGNGEKNENVAPKSARFGCRDSHVHIKNAEFTMLRFTFDLDMTRLTLAESDILYDVLFSGYNSLFFNELSEKRGLCYDIPASIERYSNLGTLTFSFEVRPSLLYESVETVISLLSSFKERLLDDSQMMRAGYVTNSPMLYDSVGETNFAFAYDNHIMNASYRSVEERAESYANVTPERIREIANIVFRSENLTLAIKGNKKKIDADNLEKIIEKL